MDLILTGDRRAKRERNAPNLKAILTVEDIGMDHYRCSWKYEGEEEPGVVFLVNQISDALDMILNNVEDTVQELEQPLVYNKRLN